MVQNDPAPCPVRRCTLTNRAVICTPPLPFLCVTGLTKLSNGIISSQSVALLRTFSKRLWILWMDPSAKAGFVPPAAVPLGSIVPEKLPKTAGHRVLSFLSASEAVTAFLHS